MSIIIVFVGSRNYQKNKKKKLTAAYAHTIIVLENPKFLCCLFCPFFSLYKPFTWFESYNATCVACLLLPLLIFSLVMQWILPSEFSYSDVPYNILWIVRGHVDCMSVCLCLCGDCIPSSLAFRHNCHNFTLTVLLAVSQFIVHVFSDYDFPCAIFRHLLAIPFSLCFLLLANYLDAAA